MKITPEPTCKTCVYAKFERTKTGRIKPDAAGRCTFEPGMPTLPVSITTAFGFHWPPTKCAIHTNMTGCPCHEEPVNGF